MKRTALGGDSAVEASKQTASDKKVDLLITVDPIGTGDYTSGATYWVELYAMSGTPYGSYLHWVYFSYVIDYWAPTCEWKSEWWGGYWRCYVKHFTYRVYYPVLRWQNCMTWNEDDWVAFAGGKGWYSSYDPGKPRPDKLYKISAHHGDFEYMLWKMEKDYKSYGVIDGLRNDFNVYENNLIMINKEKNYTNSGPQKFGIGWW